MLHSDPSPLHCREQVSKVAELLLQKETINHDDMLEILGKRPFANHKSYEDYLSARVQSPAANEQAAEEAAAAAGGAPSPTDKGDDSSKELPNLTPA